MRLATWNVNSIRSRVDRVTDWLERADVDVLAMQETKCTDAQFPTMPFAALGYDVAHVGFNQWNGVAIASRVGLEDVSIGFDGQPEWSDLAEARAIGATCGGVRVWSLYIPNGRTIEDPHYQYKLEWLAALDDTAKGWLADDPAAPIALVGDWNIAPTDEDVWDVEFFKGATHVTEPERAAFRAIEAQFSRRGKAFHSWTRAYTPTGTTRNCASPSVRACASTSCWVRPAWPPASRTPRSSATNASRARRAPPPPVITRRSWWTCRTAVRSAKA